MQFDPFVIPFNIGLYFILIYAVARSVSWFMELSRPDKLRLQRGFFGKAFGQSLKEIFLESLIHRKIIKTNPRLGYMHMSLAFGWFLLILFGTIEADIFGEKHLNPPHKAIFFRFFIRNMEKQDLNLCTRSLWILYWPLFSQDFFYDIKEV